MATTGAEDAKEGAFGAAILPCLSFTGGGGGAAITAARLGFDHAKALRALGAAHLMAAPAAPTIECNIDGQPDFKLAGDEILRLTMKRFDTNKLPFFSHIRVNNASAGIGKDARPSTHVHDEGFYFIHLDVNKIGAKRDYEKFCFQLGHEICRVFLGALRTDGIIETLCHIHAMWILEEMARSKSAKEFYGIVSATANLHLKMEAYARKCIGENFLFGNGDKSLAPIDLKPLFVANKHDEVIARIRQDLATSISGSASGLQFLATWALVRSERHQSIKWPALFGKANPDDVTTKSKEHPVLRASDTSCPWFLAKLADEETRRVLAPLYPDPTVSNKKCNKCGERSKVNFSKGQWEKPASQERTCKKCTTVPTPAAATAPAATTAATKP